MRLSRLIFLIPLALCVRIATAQSPEIRVDVTLVRIPFVAFDRDGRPVHDLRRDEITVNEEGVEQEIRYLWTELDLPLTFAFVVDISSSQLGFVRKHREATERFLARVMRPGDQGMLATVDEQPRLLVAPASSSAELARGADHIALQRHEGELIGEHCQPGRASARRGAP